MDLLNFAITAKSRKSLISARSVGAWDRNLGFGVSIEFNLGRRAGVTQPQLILPSLDSRKKTRPSRFHFTLGFPVIFIFQNRSEIVNRYLA